MDDVLDSSYTNQEHKPLYSLDNFPSNELNVIKIFCTILRLKSVLIILPQKTHSNTRHSAILSFVATCNS